jgi:hypothetical protein
MYKNKQTAQFNERLAGVIGITPAVILHKFYQLTYEVSGINKWLTYSLRNLHKDHFSYIPKNTFLRNRDKLIKDELLLFRIQKHSNVGQYNINYRNVEFVVNKYHDNLYSTKELIPNNLRKLVFERDLYRCVYCNTSNNLSVDHIIPEVLDGKTVIDNLQTLCLTCNLQKGSNLSI